MGFDIRQWVNYYRQLGLYLIPVRGKFPVGHSWQIPNKAMEFSLRRYGVGALCGHHFEVIDIDNQALLESLNIESGVVKFGRLGRASFFFKPTIGKSFSGNGWDFLSFGRHTVMPPSKHPDGFDYRWKNNFFDLDSLEEVPKEILNLLKSKYQSNTDNQLIGEGRHNNLIKLVWRLVIENNFSEFEIAQHLIEFDIKNHGTPWFSDKSEPHRGNAEQVALKMVKSAMKKAKKNNLILPKLIGDIYE